MLRTAFQRGRDGALARLGVKIAAVPLARPMPAAAGLAPSIGHAPTMHAMPAMKAPPTATTHAAAPAAAGPQPGYGLAPHEEAQAQQLKGMGHTQRAQALGLDRDSQNAAFMQQHGIDPHAGQAAPAAAPAARGGVGRFLRPAGKALGLGALAAGGALAYGMHEQNKTDRENNPLVYAPMEGGF
jgi:hypothetical protein